MRRSGHHRLLMIHYALRILLSCDHDPSPTSCLVFLRFNHLVHNAGPMASCYPIQFIFIIITIFITVLDMTRLDDHLRKRRVRASH